MAILVGFDAGTVKKDGPNKGKSFKIFHLVQDGGTNTVGQTCENVFCFDADLIEKVNEKYINQKVELIYNITNGRAFLRDVELLK